MATNLDSNAQRSLKTPSEKKKKKKKKTNYVAMLMLQQQKSLDMKIK